MPILPVLGLWLYCPINHGQARPHHMTRDVIEPGGQSHLTRTNGLALTRIRGEWPGAVRHFSSSIKLREYMRQGVSRVPPEHLSV